MKIEADEVSLFVRDRTTGRLVFNSKALEALGLSPAELAERGYPLEAEIDNPAIVPKDQSLAG
ncbi:MAG: hypothetical protein P8Y71_24945 [Pseudolabrys sp.]|jgi:hypothetical protein